MRSPIYTEKTSCQDCYKCVRNCVVKAIRLENGSALVDPDLCINCGRCYEVCPAGAKKVRKDVFRAQQLLGLKKTVVSVSPSFYSEYRERAPEILAFLKEQGVEKFIDTAIAAEWLNKELAEFLSYNSGGWISTACPAVVSYFSMYRKELKERLTPFHSPMVIQGRAVKEEMGEDWAMIFIGPCIAKKAEADLYPEWVDIALTFEELEFWIKREKWTFTGGPTPIPEKAGKTALYPVEGGMIRSMPKEIPGGSAVALSSIDQIVEAFSDWDYQSEDRFFECLSCSGGCINGPGRVKRGDALKKRIWIEDHTEKEAPSQTLSLKENSSAWTKPLPDVVEIPEFSEEEIERAFFELDKAKKSDRLNCGGCGYNTCRDFAVSYLAGKSEISMCVGNMRKLAQKKVNALISTLPLAVVMVDQNLVIREWNTPFLKYFHTSEGLSADDIDLDKITPEVVSFVPHEKEFRKALKQSDPREVRLDLNGQIYQAIFFNVEPEKLAGALFQDVTKLTVHRDTIIAKSEEVITNNLRSVQQIASLLGENAAQTEIILNSVISALNVPQGEDD